MFFQRGGVPGPLFGQRQFLVLAGLLQRQFELCYALFLAFQRGGKRRDLLLEHLHHGLLVGGIFPGGLRGGGCQFLFQVGAQLYLEPVDLCHIALALRVKVAAQCRHLFAGRGAVLYHFVQLGAQVRDLLALEPEAVLVNTCAGLELGAQVAGMLFYLHFEPHVVFGLQLAFAESELL